MKKKNWLYLSAAILLLLIPTIRIIIVKTKDLWLVDLAAYSAVSRALFEGKNPFPDHMEVLFCSFGKHVPIVFPGQMLLFALPGFLWSNAIQIAYIALNIAIVYFLTGWTLVKACGYQWNDLLKPGKKQLGYALFCFFYLFANNTMVIIRTGQIVLVLALCLYAMFWGPASHCLRILLFAYIAVTKYSILTVFAPLLFFKGHWKLCIASFGIFILFAISPIFCGNNLLEVYTGYSKALELSFQADAVNHFAMSPQMCHLAFFKSAVINYILKGIAVCPILWLFWREWKNGYFSDTLLLLALNLTMLVSYHQLHDLSLVFPLLFIRLFDFVKTKQWFLFTVTFCFLFYLIVPGAVTLTISSWLGKIPGIDSIVYLCNHPWGTRFTHVFPLTPLFTIALALWSLYLYLHVKKPYRFHIQESRNAEVAPKKWTYSQDVLD